MRRRARDPIRRLRAAVERLPLHTRQAMLRGIDANRIIVGAYVDPRSGGVCPMLAAHRNGGRTDVASFARAWDESTGARRARRATRREVRTLRSLLEASLDLDSSLERTSIAELAAQLRAERATLARCSTDSPQTSDSRRAAHRERLDIPEPERTSISVRRPPLSDLLAATEHQLFERPEQPAPGAAGPDESERAPRPG